MAIESKRYYFLRCDTPDCEMRVPSGDAEITAWERPEGAINDAQSADWEHDLDDDKWYCEDCRYEREEGAAS